MLEWCVEVQRFLDWSRLVASGSSARLVPSISLIGRGDMYGFAPGNSGRSCCTYSVGSTFDMLSAFIPTFLLLSITRMVAAIMIKTITAIPMPIPTLAPALRPEEEEALSGEGLPLGAELVVDVIDVVTVVSGVDTVFVDVEVAVG